LSARGIASRSLFGGFIGVMFRVVGVAMVKLFDVIFGVKFTVEID